MVKLEIPVMFQKGDTAYTIKRTRIEVPCHVCEGKKTIIYNDKNMKCPECMGNGMFISDKYTNIVCNEQMTISSTKISINGNGQISVKYKGYCGINSLNRSEDNLFPTRVIAQLKCDELNKEKTFIEIEDIVIQDSYKVNQPSIDKIQTKLDYYKINKKFEKDIVIDKENVLKDGYTNYLICKLLNIYRVKAIVEDVS